MLVVFYNLDVYSHLYFLIILSRITSFVLFWISSKFWNVILSLHPILFKLCKVWVSVHLGKAFNNLWEDLSTFLRIVIHDWCHRFCSIWLFSCFLSSTCFCWSWLRTHPVGILICIVPRCKHLLLLYREFIGLNWDQNVRNRFLFFPLTKLAKLILEQNFKVDSFDLLVSALLFVNYLLDFYLIHRHTNLLEWLIF